MRTVAIVTSGRADWSPLHPVARAILEHSDLILRLVACGGHLSQAQGLTIENIRTDGIQVDEAIPTALAADTAEATAVSMALTVSGLGAVYGRLRPDVLLLLGDRYETLAAAAASLPHGIPIAHLHGGEITQGAFDNAIRHAVTKMSHLHFAATPSAARRIVQMGEDPAHVFVTGAPGLDNLKFYEPLPLSELEAGIGMPLDPPPLLVTYHPVTLEIGQAARHTENLIIALEKSGMPVVFTYPNTDTGNNTVVEHIRKGMARNPGWRLVTNLGTRAYFSLMRHAAAMVGNSSSGIIEAASFGLPVVDIGLRQKGRERGKNVLWAPDEAQAILEALLRTLEPEFRSSCAGLSNPYGTGDASGKITGILASHNLNSLIMKDFHDLSAV